MLCKNYCIFQFNFYFRLFREADACSLTGAIKLSEHFSVQKLHPHFKQNISKRGEWAITCCSKLSKRFLIVMAPFFLHIKEKYHSSLNTSINLSQDLIDILIPANNMLAFFVLQLHNIWQLTEQSMLWRNHDQFCKVCQSFKSSSSL